MRRSVTCERWDIVVVPFPFTERVAVKRRPALTLSTGQFNQQGHTVLSMITSTAHHRWPGDVAIDHFEDAGLQQACIVRLKVFTLDNRVIATRIGTLSPRDRRHVAKQLRKYLWPTEGVPAAHR